jgi:hypothetical protein
MVERRLISRAGAQVSRLISRRAWTTENESIDGTRPEALTAFSAPEQEVAAPAG